MKPFLIFICSLFVSLSLFGQSADTKEITMEDIWKYKFHASSVPGLSFLKDGKHYTRLESDTIKQYDVVTGNHVKNLYEMSGINSYTFSGDESKILLRTNSERIYRRSTRARYYVYDVETSKQEEVFKKGLISNAQLSPDNTNVAFVFENNVYIKNLSDDVVTQVTMDGKNNEIINGMADWVYEEEYGFTRAFEWNVDGTKISFIRFDETNVKEYIMTNYNTELYPEFYTFKYPKVGEKNSEVSVHVYDLGTEKTFDINLKSDIEYIPRLKWTENPRDLIVFTMNRLQNMLELLVVDTKGQSTSTLLKEESKYYIDIHDNMTFVKNGSQFIWTSEKDGYNHIYLYDMMGNEVQQITSGKYDVTNFYGYDEVNDRVFYQAATKSPMDREIFSVNLKGKKKKTIADKSGTNNAQFSSTFDYYVLNHSSINQPANYSVYNRKGKNVRNIVDNNRVMNLMKTHGVTSVEFMEVPTTGNIKLNAYIMKPDNFDPNKKYPVFMYVYGGPGSQTVTNSWKGQNYWWFQSLVSKGYIVVSVDNRGTGARGEAFKKMTYKELGKYEIEDQINAAKYLAQLDYVDGGRIGMFGWSYGGYMSSLAITKGADVFKAAIAVAPVTNWKWYDTIYTERYMQTERENQKGYDDNSPINFVDLIKGDYLLIHGSSDDNVHYQHTAEMAAALIKNNVHYDTYIYTNRNHSIYGDNARLHLYTKMNNFVLEKL